VGKPKSEAIPSICCFACSTECKIEGWSFDSLRSLRTFDPSLARHERAFPSTCFARSGQAARRGEMKASRMVTLNFASWNRLVSWLRQVEAIRAVA
jgi:hypothetical protein